MKQNVWKKNLCSEIWDSLVGMKVFVYCIVSLFILVVSAVVFGTAHTLPNDISFQKTLMFKNISYTCGSVCFQFCSLKLML